MHTVWRFYRPSFPTALSNCTATEKGCEESCKQGLDQVYHDCLHFAVGYHELPKCEGLTDTDSIRDTSVVTNSDTLTSVLSVCFVSVVDVSIQCHCPIVYFYHNFSVVTIADALVSSCRFWNMKTIILQWRRKMTFYRGAPSGRPGLRVQLA